MSGPTTVADVASARTLLFVPGDRPERFAKAAVSGADVVVDLEDAVAPEAKEAARAEVVNWFAEGGVGIVRVNAPDTSWFEDDVAALAPHVDVVLMPKAHDPHAVSELVDTLRRQRPDAGVLALIETASGLIAAPAIAAVDGVVRLAFGNFDLGTELGVDPDDRDTLRSLRTQLVVASAAAGLPSPVDGVSGAIDDAAAIDADTRDARRGGYGAKLCIHPRQVPVVAAALAPSEEQVAWARRIVAVWETTTSGAVALDGTMVDKPVVDRARRVLRAADVTN